VSGALAWTAALAAALFAGSALRASLVEHPARRATGPPMGLAHFRTSRPRGARLDQVLAGSGGLAALGAWLAGAGRGWAGAGALLLLVVPYTAVALRPTERRLMDPALPPDVPEVRQLLGRWGALHALRTLAGLAAAALMLCLAAAP
jgi:hypothetical protein